MATTTLDTVLSDADDFLQVLAALGGAINPAVPVASALADKILKVAQSAVAAHEAVAGQPLDLTKLKTIAPV